MFGKVRIRHRIILLGPQSAGKTTIMYRLSEQPVPESMVPTAANVLEKQVETTDGHKFIFAEQKVETPDASAIIFVIPRPDLDAGITSLKQFLSSSLQRQIPLLVLVNKQDGSDGDDLNEVCAEITPLVGIGRSWAVWGCSGTQNIGLTDVITWLETKLPIS